MFALIGCIFDWEDCFVIEKVVVVVVVVVVESVCSAVYLC